MRCGAPNASMATSPCHRQRWWDEAEVATVVERVDITLAAIDGATELELRHRGPWLDGNAADDYRIGWTQVFDVLTRTLVASSHDA